MSTQYLFATPLILSSAIMCLLLIHTVRNRRLKGSLTLSAILVGCVIWTSMKVGEVLANDLSDKIMFLKLEYTGITLIAPALLLFTIRFTGLYRDINWRDIGSLLLVPIVTYAFAVTNDLHGLFWRSFSLESGLIDHIDTEPGFVYYIHLVYTYLLVILSLSMLMVVLIRNKESRLQTGSFIGAILLPLTGGILFDLGMSPLPEMDAAPLMFSLSGLLLTLAIFKFKILEKHPITRDIIFDNIADPIIFLDPRGRVSDMNSAAEEMADVERKDSLGRDITEILPLDESRLRGLLKGEPKTLEVRNRKGRVLIQSFAMGDSRLLILRDITRIREAEEVLNRSREELEAIVRSRTEDLVKEAKERRSAEERALEEANRAELLLDLMGHDIGNLNQAIYGRVQLMKQNRDDHGWLKNQIENLDESMSRAVELVQNIRIMSLLERTDPEPVPVNISRMVRKCAEMVKVAFPGRNLVFHDGMVHDNVMANAEPILERAIYNVIHNAVKVQKTDPAHVWLAARRQGKGAVVEVSDQGPGIPPDKKLVLTERKKRSGDTSLSGVGLMFSNTVVERHGGRIVIRDRVDGDWGQGAKFVIELP